MQFRTRVAFVAFGFYLGASASTAAQTTPRPGVDCSLLTPTQAQGLVCATPPRPEIAPPLVVILDGASAADCEPYPSPYAEPDRAARCAAWQRSQTTAPALPTFTTGATYVYPYPEIRMVVLSVTLSSAGVAVVTGEYISGAQAGQVFAFRVDQPQPWTRVP